MLVDPEEFLLRRYSSRFQRPTALAVRTARACGLRLLAIAHGREFEIFSHAEAITSAELQGQLPFFCAGACSLGLEPAGAAVVLGAVGRGSGLSDSVRR